MQIHISAADGIPIYLQIVNQVKYLVASGRRHVVLNLADVSYVDSSGLGSLVAVFLSARKQGGALKLLNPSKRLHDLLAIAKLLTVLDISDSEAQAVASFSTV